MWTENVGRRLTERVRQGSQNNSDVRSRRASLGSASLGHRPDTCTTGPADSRTRCPADPPCSLTTNHEDWSADWLCVTSQLLESRYQQLTDLPWFTAPNYNDMSRPWSIWTHDTGQTLCTQKRKKSTSFSFITSVTKMQTDSNNFFTVICYNQTHIRGSAATVKLLYFISTSTSGRKAPASHAGKRRHIKTDGVQGWYTPEFADGYIACQHAP